MPITPFLDDPKFDPETKRVVGVAFEIARVALRLAERSDLADEMIAKRIIELAKTGELNPDLPCEAVLKEFPKPNLPREKGWSRKTFYQRTRTAASSSVG